MKGILIVSLLILPLTACSFGKKTGANTESASANPSEKAVEVKTPAGRRFGGSTQFAVRRHSKRRAHVRGGVVAAGSRGTNSL